MTTVGDCRAEQDSLSRASRACVVRPSGVAFVEPVLRCGRSQPSGVSFPGPLARALGQATVSRCPCPHGVSCRVACRRLPLVPGVEEPGSGSAVTRGCSARSTGRVAAGGDLERLEERLSCGLRQDDGVEKPPEAVWGGPHAGPSGRDDRCQPGRWRLRDGSRVCPHARRGGRPR